MRRRADASKPGIGSRSLWLVSAAARGIGERAPNRMQATPMARLIPAAHQVERCMPRYGSSANPAARVPTSAPRVLIA